jgi:hypothetical protein
MLTIIVLGVEDPTVTNEVVGGVDFRFTEGANVDIIGISVPETSLQFLEPSICLRMTYEVPSVVVIFVPLMPVATTETGSDVKTGGVKSRRVGPAELGVKVVIGFIGGTEGFFCTEGCLDLSVSSTGGDLFSETEVSCLLVSAGGFVTIHNLFSKLRTGTAQVDAATGTEVGMLLLFKVIPHIFSEGSVVGRGDTLLHDCDAVTVVGSLSPVTETTFSKICCGFSGVTFCAAVASTGTNLCCIGIWSDTFDLAAFSEVIVTSFIGNVKAFDALDVGISKGTEFGLGDNDGLGVVAVFKVDSIRGASDGTTVSVGGKIL